MVATRSPTVGRFILDVERVPEPGSEASIAVSCFERLAPHVSGTQAIVYETALRGVHHQKILRELGIVPVNMVAAAETFASKTSSARSSGARRPCMSRTRTSGSPTAPPSGSISSPRRAPSASCARRKRVSWSSPPRPQENTQDEGRRLRPVSLVQRLPAPRAHRRGQITVRLHQNDADRKRKFNRTENVRPSLPRTRTSRASTAAGTTPNRSTGPWRTRLFLGRAHSLGWRRQQVEMLGWAVMVNALTMARHRAAEGLEAAA